MTEQYTPTTEEVRDSYRFSNKRPDICGKDFGAEFDRWLAEVRREAAEKALTDAADECATGYESTDNSAVASWLRKRAEAYRKVVQS